MMRHQICLILATACLMFTKVNSAIVAAGVCDERTFTGPSVTIDQLVASGLWNATWVTNTPPLDAIDQAVLRFQPDTTTPGQYTMLVEILMSNSNLLLYKCSFEAGPNNEYFINTCVDDYGNVSILRYYVLYFIEGRAVYTYRCLVSNDPSTYILADVRFIAAFADTVLTNDEVQTIKSLDASIFSGGLLQLPRSLPPP